MADGVASWPERVSYKLRSELQLRRSIFCHSPFTTLLRPRGDAIDIMVMGSRVSHTFWVSALHAESQATAYREALACGSTGAFNSVSKLPSAVARALVVVRV